MNDTDYKSLINSHRLDKLVWTKFNGKNVPPDKVLLGHFEKNGIRTFKYDSKDDLWDLGNSDVYWKFSGGLTHFMELPRKPKIEEEK